MSDERLGLCRGVLFHAYFDSTMTTPCPRLPSRMRLLQEIRMILHAFGIAKRPISSAQIATQPGVVQLPIDPDQPSSFGYKISWIAVRTENAASVATALALTKPRPVCWHEGITLAYEYESPYVFLTPPIDSWTCAVGHGVGSRWIGKHFCDMPETIICELSRKFGVACYFGSHRVSDWYAWMRSDAGTLTRAFGHVDSEYYLDVGSPTPQERHLGLDAWSEERWPNEDDVIKIASAWSIDPIELDTRKEPRSKGLLTKIHPRPPSLAERFAQSNHPN